jgi:phage gp36-like protein
VALELKLSYVSGVSAAPYAIVRRLSDLHPWNGTAIEPWNDANITTYAIALADKSGDQWAADIPAALPVDDYLIEYYDRAFAAAATVDDNLLTKQKLRWNGSTVVVVPPPGGAVGRYVDQAYLEQVYDPENIRSWSRKGGSGSTDTLAVQAAIDSAEDQIDRRLAFRYVLPFVVLSLTTGDVQTLKRLAARIAVYELYKARGLRDDDAIGNLLTKDRDEALAELETYYAGQNFLNATRIDRVNRTAELVS